MHRWITGIFVAAMTITTVTAQTLYLPAAANADGVNQTTWRTDLQVKSQGAEPAAFTIELLESGKDNSTPAQVERWLKPFRIERSFLLRHGIREFIAVNG